MPDKDYDTVRGFNHGTKPIQLELPVGFARECRPFEIHIKEDGALDKTPSLCLVMTDFHGFYYGQISVKMLNQALKEAGYKLEKL